MSKAKLEMKDYIASKEKKQIYVNQMFSTIAPRYDLVTSMLSYGQDKKWKKKLVDMAEVNPHHQLLDLACGTGDITFMLAERISNGKVIGVDITPSMIAIANDKKRRLGKERVTFEVGDIMQLNYPSNSFDRITIGYGVRNVPDIYGLLSEVLRMLKSGGWFLSLDFGKPSQLLYRAVFLRYLSLVGSTFGWILHRYPDVYRYIPESLKLYPGQEGVRILMEAVGFIHCGYATFMGGVTAINYGGKG